MSYIKSILDPDDKSFDRLECPAPATLRYDYLQVDHNNADTVDKQVKYFFALNLRQSIDIIPRLLGSIVEAIKFLGPQSCALSIVEGHSDDGTLEVLEALHKDLGSLGVEYFLKHSEIDSKEGDRIEGLAALRNLALDPLSSNPSHYSSATSVIFINDVAICMEDILELIHQRLFQKADMTCAMDWNDIDPAPIFYDIWIARSIIGDTFWELPPDGGWHLSAHLFWNHELSRQRYEAHKAFQVFACWNGAVVFTAKPVMRKEISFRRSRPEECYAGEPRLFCKDLWMKGYGRIAVVPSVNLEYTDEKARKAKRLHGYVSEAVKAEDANNVSTRIVWEAKPPDKVKCMSDFADQSWVPWNEGFESQS